MFIDLISVRLWVKIIKQNWLNIYVCVKLSRCLLLIKLSSIPGSFHRFLIWNILVESNLAIYHKKLKTQVSYFSWCCLKNPRTIQETWVWSLSWEEPLEKGIATPSSILAWKNHMDRGVWQVIVNGVTKRWTCLSD